MKRECGSRSGKLGRGAESHGWGNLGIARLASSCPVIGADARVVTKTALKSFSLRYRAEQEILEESTHQSTIMVLAATNFSNDLLWLCIRNESSFIVKRPNEKMFSREPLNLTNKHTAKYSGLANDKIIGVQSGKNGKGVTLITKGKKETDNSPRKNIVKSTLRNSSAKVREIESAGHARLLTDVGN